MTRLFIVFLSGLLLTLIGGCGDETTVESSVEPAPVIRVPGDVATIQGAIDAILVRGTVLVGSGVYTGNGNWDLDFGGKAITLRAEAGPDSTIIDCEDPGVTPHFAIQLIRQENGAVIDGFTIRNGSSNEAGAIRCRGASPIIQNCVFENNEADVSGGAIRCKGASPTIVNCTFVNNTAQVGAAIYLIGGSSPVIQNCVFAYNEAGGSIYSNDATSVPVIRCSNIYGNTYQGGDGDWFERIASQSSQSGNFSSDPMFCDSVGDYRLTAGSPCLPANNGCARLIGALEQGCP